MKRNLKQRLLGVKFVLLDVDGVLTDGRIYKTQSGEEMLAFHIRDGMGITALREAGIEVALFSGRASGAMKARAQELGIEKLYIGIKDKEKAIEDVARDANLDLESVAFVGDDLPDIEALKKVGLAVAVADAADEVKNVAHLTLDTPGGRGSVRELAEKVLKAQNKWVY